MSNTIAAIILTKNEEKHIARCIGSLKNVCDEVIVVDSFSSDKTCEIAKSHGAEICRHAFVNHARQFNWALEHCDIKSEWIWRIDADEYLEGNIGSAVKEAVKKCDSDVNGIYVRKRIDFMGKQLKHGGWYPTYHLKVFRKGHGECENRGKTITVDEGNQVDANLNGLTWWTDKHNHYATREMIDMLMTEFELDAKGQEVIPMFFGTEEQRKRWLKMKYVKAPLFVRPFANFFYRYIIRGGFLDGKEGFIWHILQGFWYRMLVDAKIFEIKKKFNSNPVAIKEFLKDYLACS